ncbi:rab-GTPase-TBC domain-containing protein [Fomes fomentarius]|nr:rab-GTPase-TBC domain-containing protein [Fomes fomentarius]
MDNDTTEKQGLLDGEPNAVDSLDWQAYRLLSLQPHGFGVERVHIWPRLLHVDPDVVKDRRESTDIFVWSEVSLDEILSDVEGTPEGEPHEDERQIELDTDRSFVLYPVEGVKSRETLQAALNRLIVSVFRRRPRLHYFQGYHDIVSVVFLTLPKELHLPVVEKLSLHRVRDSMGTNLDPVVGLLRILQRLLHLADPNFAAILDRTAPLPYYALSNLLTLFSHDVPTLPLVQHIFDYLLCRPPIAVVYLAAAFILTRREEVQILEDEGEEGMMHSLLTVLPDLYEEGEEPPVPVKSEESSPSPSASVHGTKTEGAEPTIPPHAPSADVTDVPRGADDAEGDTHVAGTPADPQSASTRSDASDISVHSTLPASTSEALQLEAANEPDPEFASSAAVVSEATSSDPVSEPVLESQAPLKVEDASDPQLHKSDPDTRTSSPEPLDVEPKHDAESEPEPEPEARPHRPRVTVSSLLQDADDLFTLYPPTHPQIALASIMGPQSVVLTWSERAADLPEDDEAELMVTRPELVVLPHVERSDSDSDEGGAGGRGEKGSKGRRRREREKEEREKRRRRLRKPRRLTDIVVQRKTMVAGAMIVLGVAVAVYGLNGGLPGMGNGHHRGGIGKEWRKVGKVLGGITGVGGKLFDGLRRGLE